MNGSWHQQHRMPKNASLAARIAWHVAHRKACACRPVPASILAALGESGGKPAAAGASLKAKARPAQKGR